MPTVMGMVFEVDTALKYQDFKGKTVINNMEGN
jgi:hypothetical protein